jgi:hypothetical protein
MAARVDPASDSVDRKNRYCLHAGAEAWLNVVSALIADLLAKDFRLFRVHWLAGGIRFSPLRGLKTIKQPPYFFVKIVYEAVGVVFEPVGPASASNSFAAGGGVFLKGGCRLDDGTQGKK